MVPVHTPARPRVHTPLFESNTSHFLDVPLNRVPVKYLRADVCQIVSCSSYSCLAAHFFQETILACFSCIFFMSCGQTTLMPTATCPSNSKVCHCGNIFRSQEEHRRTGLFPLCSAFSKNFTLTSCFFCQIQRQSHRTPVFAFPKP